MTAPQPEPICVAALYRFADVADPQDWRDRLEAACEAEGVRGTLLIAFEGINGTIAGSDAAIARVLEAIRSKPAFEKLDVKYSRAATMPFHRLKVRVKPEIVTLGKPGIDGRDAGIHVMPQDWNALIADPDTLVIDTRNDYEVRVGTFEGAVDPGTSGFRDFPAWFAAEGRDLIAQRRPARVAMFCTGGIRCEKSTALLKAEGVGDVRHLKGGILNYLEHVPEADSLWQGECFVFDQRVAVGHDLKPGTHTLCHGCRMPVSAQDRASPHHVEGVACVRCHDRAPERRAGRAERHRQVKLAETRGDRHIGVRQAGAQPKSPHDVAVPDRMRGGQDGID